MYLDVLETSPTSVSAGYSCPCGCTPSVTYRRGEGSIDEGCCCGNQFVVGPEAGASIVQLAGFRYELQTFAAPWGERLEAAWLIGPSRHDGHEHGDGRAHAMGHHGDGETESGKPLDPVCGMTVDADAAQAKGLHSVYKGSDYYFCGRGCKLDFDEEPERYLAPDHVPSM